MNGSPITKEKEMEQLKRLELSNVLNKIEDVGRFADRHLKILWINHGYSTLRSCI